MTHRDVTLDKIGYMMSRMGGDDELTAADLEAMIHKVFTASFEYEHGFEAELISALVDARHALLWHETGGDEDDPTYVLSGTDAEKWYLACQKEMFQQAGFAESYAEESSTWPDALPLHADWDADLLKSLARKEVAHHLVVMEQIRREMEKHGCNPTEPSSSSSAEK